MRRAKSTRRDVERLRLRVSGDEIENWPELLSADVPASYLTIPHTETVHDFQQDPRWKHVAAELQTTCELVGIDQSYVEPKIKFRKLHESGDPKYKQFFRRAERIKIMAMGKISRSKADEQTEYFLRGVQRHDNWDDYESTDEAAVEIISEFYRQVQREKSHG